MLLEKLLVLLVIVPYICPIDYFFEKFLNLNLLTDYVLRRVGLKVCVFMPLTSPQNTAFCIWMLILHTLFFLLIVLYIDPLCPI